MRILPSAQNLMAILRVARDNSERVLCLVNISKDLASASFTDTDLGLIDERGFTDLISGDYVYPSRDDGNRISLELQPYEIMWLKY